jgi:hypothetical protein
VLVAEGAGAGDVEGSSARSEFPAHKMRDKVAALRVRRVGLFFIELYFHPP